MSCFWKRREWKSTFCKTHREQKEQQMSNSAAVIAQFCGERWSSVTFQGVEHQLHGIYMISCIFTPIVWYCSQEREFHNGRRLRRIPAGNEVVHGHLRVVQLLKKSCESCEAFHCLSASSSSPPSWASPGLEVSHFCKLWNLLLPFMWKGHDSLSSLQWQTCPEPSCRQRQRGREGQVLAALWQPGPARCLPLNIKPAQFSAAHTLQQQREALHSVQLQLLEKHKKGKGVYFWRTNFLQAPPAGAVVWALSGLCEMWVVSIQEEILWDWTNQQQLIELWLLEEHWKDAKTSLLCPRGCASHRGKWFV